MGVASLEEQRPFYFQLLDRLINGAGPGIARRCDQELRYQPAKIGARVSPFDLEIAPRIESLQINPLDPLDP